MTPNSGERTDGGRIIEHRVRIPLRTPYKGMGEREVVLLEGPAGWGECSPLPGYPCDPAAARSAALEAACGEWPAPVRDRVPVNALITAALPGDAAREAANAVADGYRTIKIKLAPLASLTRTRVVGSDFRTHNELANAVAIVGAVRDAVGKDVALRVDCNAAFTVETATELIAALESFDLQFVEQPVSSIDDLARLRRRVNVPLAADECVRSIDDALRLRSLGAADVLVAKVQPLGGIRSALDIAEAVGVPVIVSSMIETSVGLSAGLALAACLPDLPYACGLSTASLLAGDVVADPLFPEGGWIRVRRPEPDPALLRRYAVST